MIRRVPAAVRAIANIWRSVRQRTEVSAELPYRLRRMAPLNPMESSMKRTVIVSAVMAVFLTAGGSSFAEDQGNGNRNDRGRDDRTQGQGQQDRHDTQARQPDRRDSQGHTQHGQQHAVRGAGPNHNFYRGERLPTEYRHRQYVVEDWRGHHLSAPPRGYHWVQTGADYVLVAVATGVILQLLLSN
jgi:Ni/Co efflux regulator RcnB